MEIKLLIDNANIEIDHFLLESIVENMPDIKENIKVHEKLANSSNWIVREHIAKKQYINRKTIKKLLKDIKVSIISALLQNSYAAQQIKHKELIKIIENGNPTHLMIIVESIAYFERADKIIIQDMLKKHKDPNIRDCFVSGFGSSEISKDILKILEKDDDLAIRTLAMLKLKQ